MADYYNNCIPKIFMDHFNNKLLVFYVQIRSRFI